MQIGPYEIHLLMLGQFRMDGGGLFGIVPKKLWKRAYPHVDEENRVRMAAKALLIIGEGAVVVADAGIGDKLDEKARAIFCVEQPESALEQALRKHGTSPEQVTHFVYTHMHFDHAGGATQVNAEGKAVPMFPQARHYVQREHLAWARSPSDKDRVSFMPANWEPVCEAALLEELDGPMELLPGIELTVVHGHTRAMQMVTVRDWDSGFIYTVDLFPTLAHLPPQYVAAFDNYPLEVIDEKRRLLAEAASGNWILAFGHDAVTAAVTVRQMSSGYGIAQRFAPGEL
jgi:glyoxylase-like metal-dependent hydrolase (beta-lactamase superfamily II)